MLKMCQNVDDKYPGGSVVEVARPGSERFVTIFNDPGPGIVSTKTDDSETVSAASSVSEPTKPIVRTLQDDAWALIDAEKTAMQTEKFVKV
jgi:hypothetical protein